MGKTEQSCKMQPQIMNVQVPAGMGPGNTIRVMGTNGQPFDVAVPQGVLAGQTFQCQMPAAPAVVMGTAPQQQIMQQAQPPTIIVQEQRPQQQYRTENYCGVISLLIGLFIFPCICCCPVD